MLGTTISFLFFVIIINLTLSPASSFYLLFGAAYPV